MRRKTHKKTPPSGGVQEGIQMLKAVKNDFWDEQESLLEGNEELNGISEYVEEDAEAAESDNYCSTFFDDVATEIADRRMREMRELAARVETFKHPHECGAFEVILAMLRKDGCRFMVVNDELRVYDSDLGYFRAFSNTGKNSFRKFLEQVAPIYWKQLYLSKLSEQIAAYVKDNLEIFGYTPKLKHASIDPVKYINFRNGIFNLRSGELHKHSPKYQALSVVDADFIEGEWQMPEMVQQFFEHLGNGEIGAQALIQLGGIAIAPTRNLQVGGFLIGEGGSGKGVFTEILRALLPNDNVLTFALEGLSQRFALKGLATAKLAICPELNIGQPQSADIRVLKSLISGDKIIIERKYKDPEEVRPYATIICCGNAFPQGIMDASGAMQRRIMLVKTGPSIQKRNPNLLKELMVYKNFIATAFARAASAVYNGEKLLSDDLPNVIGSPRVTANQEAEDWLRKHVVPDQDGTLNITEAYRRFVENTEGDFKMDNRAFGVVVAKLFDGAKRRRSDGSYVRYGWRFVD